ncbi:heterodisulfide reductase-related iron-sulfur binding cluster [Aeromicrobium duanguangcaii]|uniref:heterodisulfide reductase-related iron-sulfur binding cluster n=1 Tax=Aeromicrobium duanguangcaii TaxID=2968086 RepID=UPI00201710FD|nr:heterodisulfide reductase-related iron-sulfur binding cluster [Aeromicrobium duanguangcaii]MCL3838383.1 heterodisulfide reductase-related iron-sulfur binding cluster [Aeromicrobium duanguangcaii]
MEPINIIAGVITVVSTALAVYYLAPGIKRMLGVIRAGTPAYGRTDNPKSRTKNMLIETLGHTRMLQWHWVGILHWAVFFSFVILSTAVATAYLQVWNPHLVLPLIGHFFLFEWVSEAIAWLGLIGIAALIVIRQRNHPRNLGRKSRFFGSRFGQAYFVEAMVALECGAGILIRGAEYQLMKIEGDSHASAFHFPLTGWIGETLWSGMSVTGLEAAISIIAVVKVVSATVWLMVIGKNLTMGVAWHRFLAWFNIYFKREADGSTALGALVPLYVGGKPLDLETMEDMEEEEFEKLGVGKVEDFSWKSILDFSTCTECGRCQSQCPAWNTEKPLSPKLLMMGLREHAYAKVPLLGADPETLTEEQQRELERPLIGSEDLFGVIDPDVLWSCTNCGACVQQCPVDIEHVDHIDNMRRYQVLVESNFPTELNNIFKGLERKGNPWGMNPRDRMKWAEDLDFEVKQVGVDVESLDEVEWLFWVGCAGAFEDRAKKTTQAVAELLDIAGVTFAVLGDGETCSGDSARRAGNEIVFKQLAMENVATFQETKVKKVVSTCAHCFNTLKNEYKELGIELEVVHHTQLLNRLVREKKLKPVAPAAPAAKVTYHDPCFLGRHNQVYSPPRELIGATGADYVEMDRSKETSFCCGAGGARMWMEEKIGSRININRTEEAIGTGADKIAVGCPFCRVMLADGLTAKQADDESLVNVEVLDVAQLLLEAVKRSEEDVVAEAEALVIAAEESHAGDEPEDAEPGPEAKADAGTLTDTEEVGAAADAHESGDADGGDDLDDPDSASREADAEVAAKHNIAVDDKGTAGGIFESGDATPEGAADAEGTKPVSVATEPEDEPAQSDPEPEAVDNAVSQPEFDSTDEQGPAQTEKQEGLGQPDADAVKAEAEPTEEPTPEADAKPAAESTPDPEPKTEAAPATEPEQPSLLDSIEDEPKHHTAIEDEPKPEPHPESGDVTNPDAEGVVYDDPRPEIPAEKHAEPTSEEEELAAITPVEDAPAPDPVSEDAAPLSDANPSGQDLSGSATDASNDEDDDTKA